MTILWFCSLRSCRRYEVSSYKFGSKGIDKKFWGLTRVDPKVREQWLQNSLSLFPCLCQIICRRHVYLGHLGNRDALIITLTTPMCIKLCHHSVRVQPVLLRRLPVDIGGSLYSFWQSNLNLFLNSQWNLDLKISNLCWSSKYILRLNSNTMTNICNKVTQSSLQLFHVFIPL